MSILEELSTLTPQKAANIILGKVSLSADELLAVAALPPGKVHESLHIKFNPIRGKGAVTFAMSPNSAKCRELVKNGGQEAFINLGLFDHEKSADLYTALKGHGPSLDVLKDYVAVRRHMSNPSKETLIDVGINPEGSVFKDVKKALAKIVPEMA